MDIGDEFLLTCKKNFFDKVTPSNKESRQKEGYKRLVAIAKEYFSHNEYAKFTGFFQEGQYFVALWAAHLVLEYGTGNQETILSAMNIIKEYSDNPLEENVANEEKRWLEANDGKY